ncbi:MAG: TRAP transporter small permease subunit [Beijerinckiaceae bacterium]
MLSTFADAATRGRLLIERLTLAMGLAAGWGFILCAFFISFDVLARKFLGISSQATTEITAYMLAMGLTWGMAHTLSMRAHVRIDLLINRLPLGYRQWLHLTSLLALGIFVGFLTKAAYDLVDESLMFRATDTSVLRIPLAWPQGIWAAGLGVFALTILVMFMENLLLTLAGRGAEAERNLMPRGFAEEVEEALDAVGTQTTTISAKQS